MTRSILLILTSVSLAVTGQLMLKLGMTDVGQIQGGDFLFYKQMLFRAVVNPKVLVGFACYIVSAVIWLIVLSRVQLSFAYPFGGLGYIAMLFFSRVALGETVTPIRWLGIVFIFLGIVFISRS